MIYLVSTPQRCGSTWLTRMLCAMADSRDVYVDGLRLGFRLLPPCEPGAVEKLAAFFQRRPAVRVFKTHDVGAKDFDAICAAIPELRVLTLHRDFRDVVVSRYFYLRYYWRNDPRLGALPVPVAQFFARIGGMPDRAALAAMLDAPFMLAWAREWAAFEREFSTPHALRMRYAGMLDESDFPRLAKFTGLRLRKAKPFASEQAEETQQTGRTGMVRFNRRGRAGEWREWFTPEDGAMLESMALDECRRQGAERSGVISIRRPSP